MSQSEMLEAALREYELEQVQEEVLRILEPGNEFLQDLVDKFGETRSQASKAHVACFFELKSSNVGAIVGRQARTVRWTALNCVEVHLQLSVYWVDCRRRDLLSAKAQAVSTLQTRRRSTPLSEITSI